jgi:hypothetical protein
MVGITIVLLDALGFLTTSVVGKVMEKNDNIEDSHFTYLLIPLYIGLIAYFVQIVWSRIGKMIMRCSLFSLAHLIGDLGRIVMEVLIILGICISLIDGEVYDGYKFHAVVLVYGIYKFFGWLRFAIGGFTNIGYYNGDIFHGPDVLPDDKKEKKKVQAAATFLFKMEENGFSVNKRNWSQMGDMTRLFISIACLTIWNDFDDPAQMASDLYGVFVATLVWACLYFVYHIGLYIYLKNMMSGMDVGDMMSFIFTMVFLIMTSKGFMVATLVGTLHGAADYLDAPSETLFDFSISLACLMVFQVLLWMFMFGKIYKTSKDMAGAV